ncbi:DUF4102 domain-containing protein [Agrobacterium salinitolerans]|nr:DUF4102 domain-containing protein [Agrobacterium salinitolerans]
MARTLNRLSALVVKNAGAGKYADGGGLWLIKREDGGGQWVLRFTIHGRRREMGLGSIAEVSLKEAREESERWRAVARSGLDPISQREKNRREAVKRLHLLKDVAADAFESRKAELKGDGKAGRWFSPLELHILPKLGKTPVAEIDQTQIRDVLSPIWHAKAETARKALNYMSVTPPNARVPIVADMMTDINNALKNGGSLDGKTYQSLRSRLDRVARGSSDPELANTLRDIRSALDDGMERSIAATNPKDLGGWRNARKEYRNMLVLEQAATGAGEK